MKPLDLKKQIAARHVAGIARPLWIESSPGIGKTSIVEQSAKELGVDCIILHAPLMQPEDYGFPVISADRNDVKFIVPKNKFAIDPNLHGKGGLLCFDDAGQSENYSQKIIANIVEARELHGNKILPNWSIIMTGNREKDRAGSNKVLTHLGNRVTFLGLDVSIDDWTQWALGNGVKTEIVAFIRFRPDLLNTFDPNNKINATPRSWVKGVNAALGKIDPASEFEVFSGDIGNGAASEFLAFLKICRELPDPDQIILDPDGAKVPLNQDGTPNSSVIYATCGALNNRTTPANFGRVMQYIKRLPAEFSVLFVRDALARLPELAKSKDFIAWASSDGARLLS
jgi:hypothetical protein